MLPVPPWEILTPALMGCGLAVVLGILLGRSVAMIDEIELEGVKDRAVDR